MKTRLRLLVLPAALVLACSGGPEPAGSTTVPSTSSTTTIPSTTTTVQPFSIENAPSELTALLEGFYDYATGRSDQAPAAPDGVLSALGRTEAPTPLTGEASLGTFQGQEVGTVELDDDLFLVVAESSEWRVVGGRWPSLSVPAHFGGGPRHVAVVGSDARPGEDVAATRADSIHFIGLDGEGGAAVVGLPRDSYVPVPGLGSRKITGSLALGGPDTMMAAFEDLTRLPLEGYVLTGFAGFQELLDSVLGGVEVEVPFPIDDTAAKANLRAGLQVLDGFDALAFARARKTLPGGDLTRSFHQGEILVAAARGVRSMGYGAIPRMLEAAEPHLITDLTPEQLLTFSAMVLAADLDDVPNIVAPGRLGTAGGASVVFLTDEAEALWADLEDGRLDE